MNESSLESWLGFDDADLAANRTGRLSDGQRARLAWSATWRLLVGPPLIVGAPVMGIQVDTALLIVLAMVVAGIGLYITWRGFAFAVDALERSVAFVSGPLKGTEVHTKNGTAYYAVIGPVSKRIKRVAYCAMPLGSACHLYYAPGCRSLLAVEPSSAAEPLPDHPFGPDSAHAWDRLRWSWVLMTVGAFGILVGAHAVASAHPAVPVRVDALVSDYVETHGKSTTRTLYLAGAPNSFTPRPEDDYSPPSPPFATLIGREIVVYVDAGTSDVLALTDGDQLHASDWYLHPDHKTTFEAVNGAVAAALAALALLSGIGWIVLTRRTLRAASREDPNAPAVLFAPPTARPLSHLWRGSLITIGALLAVVAVFGLALAGRK